MTMKKKVLGICVAVTVMISTTIMAFASGSYSTTYDMTGGVFSKWIQPTSECKVTINPTKGTSNCDMGVVWAKKTWFGWDGDVKNVSSVSSSTVTFKSSEKRKVWLRNYAGTQWTGAVTFSWD